MPRSRDSRSCHRSQPRLVGSCCQPGGDADAGSVLVAPFAGSAIGLATPVGLVGVGIGNGTTGLEPSFTRENAWHSVAFGVG